MIAGLAGRRVPGRRVDFGGLPGYAYRVRPGSPSGAVSRLYVLFDGQVEYFFNCQSTPEARPELDGACDGAAHPRAGIDLLERVIQARRRASTSGLSLVLAFSGAGAGEARGRPPWT